MPTGVQAFSLNPNYQLEFSYNVIGWEMVYPEPPYTPFEGAVTEYVYGIRSLTGPSSLSGSITVSDAFGHGGSPGHGESFPATFNMAGKDYTEVVRFTITEQVPDSDVTVWGTIADSVDLGNATVQLNGITLPVRSSATLPTFTPEVFDAGTPISIKWTGSSSTYTHDIFYTFADDSRVQIFANQPQSSTGLSYTPPLTLINKIPNATSAPYTITMVTRQGATVIGERSFQGTLRVPSGLGPTVSGYAISDTNSAVTVEVGKYVQGLSVLRVDSIAATAQSDATIVNTRLDFEGQSLRVGDTKQILTSGTLPVTARAWDSRGLTGSLGGSIDVLAYTAPTVVGLVAFRSDASGNPQDDGEYIRTGAVSQASSLMNGTERNSLHIKVETRPYGTSTWTVRNDFDAAGLTHNTAFTIDGGAIFAKTDSFDVRYTASDKFNSTVVLATVAKGEVTLDLQRNGVGVGKLWAQGSVDAAGQMYQNNGALVVDSVTIPTYLNMHRGTAVQRAATTARYWEFWQDTDGTQKIYVGNKTGGWRQFSGEASAPSAAWDFTSGSILAGRSANIVLPAVLEANEHIICQTTDVGSGFGFMSISSITRGVSNTTLSVRFMQILSTSTQAYKFSWHIIQL